MGLERRGCLAIGQLETGGAGGQGKAVLCPPKATRSAKARRPVRWLQPHPTRGLADLGPSRDGVVMGSKDPRGKSLVTRRNVRIDGHLTTLSLEGAFWNAFKEIAAAQQTEIGLLVKSIDSKRRKAHHVNLSSAIRLFVLDYYRGRLRP